MNTHFGYFVENIPEDIYSNTKSYICQYIAVFEPEEYAVGEVICVDDYHFVLFCSNSPVTRISNIDYQFKKGDLAVIQPWEEVYGVSYENIKNGKYIHIAVKKDFFRKIATEITGREAFEFKRIQNNYSKQLLDLIGNFQRELMDYGETYPVMIESICVQLVCQLIRDINADTAANRSKVTKNNKYINKAIQIMQDYYSSNININDICNIIYLSPCHFKRVFKEHTGHTPYQYLIRIRLEKAKELLGKHDISMEEAARLCGFVNPGHFSTVFKRNVGMSPSEFRKMGE